MLTRPSCLLHRKRSAWLASPSRGFWVSSVRYRGETGMAVGGRQCERRNKPWAAAQFLKETVALARSHLQQSLPPQFGTDAMLLLSGQSHVQCRAQWPPAATRPLLRGRPPAAAASIHCGPAVSTSASGSWSCSGANTWSTHFISSSTPHKNVDIKNVDY